MIILPAIDMIDGQPVRLVQGNYEEKTVVASSVIETARHFEKDGAKWIHMVDLDGAKAGHPVNDALIAKVASETSMFVEAGGGIRTMEDIERYLSQGIKRIILGTAAINDGLFLRQALCAYGDAIAIGMDCKNGYACTDGWLSTSSLYYLDFAKRLASMGVKNIIFTDISKDGTLKGPNFEMLGNLCAAVDVDITASGGVKDIEDIKELARMGLYGAIAGKAIYHGSLDLAEAIRVAA